MSARAVTAQVSVCPPPATGGEGGGGRGDYSSSLVLKIHCNPQESEQHSGWKSGCAEQRAGIINENEMKLQQKTGSFSQIMNTPVTKTPARHLCTLLSWILCANQHWSENLQGTSILERKNSQRVIPFVKIWAVLWRKSESSFLVIILYWMWPLLPKWQEAIWNSSAE